MPRVPHSTYRTTRLFILVLMAAGLTSLFALLSDQSLSTESAGAKALSTLNPRNSSSIDTASSEALREQVDEAYGKLPLRFEANEGQADERVKFISRGVGYTLFLTADEAVLALRGAQEGTGGAAQGSEEARNQHHQRQCVGRRNDQI